MKEITHDGTKGSPWQENKDEYMVFKLVKPAAFELHTTTGPYAHYVGSATVEKKSGSIYQLLSLDDHCKHHNV
jgi:hypothetical protein